jgi:hypothetical protein
LADSVWRDEERYATAYLRAFESPKGQLLYAAREVAPFPPEPIRKREPERISKAEAAIADAVAAYRKEHSNCSPEKALLKVLEARPQLYQAYERESSTG